MVDLVEYKRPLIVLLIFASLIFFISNFGGHIFSSETFIDPQYKCANDSATRNDCIKVGGFWKEDGKRPAECDSNCACCVPNAAFPLSVAYPSSVCPASNDTFSYTDALKVSNNSFLLTKTDATILAADALTTHIQDLQTAGKLMAAPPAGSNSSDIYKYLQQDEAALQTMQGEYCYYAARYRYCVTQIIQSGTNPSASNTNSATDWVTAARILNARLMNLVGIMKTLTTTRMQMGPDMSNGVAKLNADLSVRMSKLSEQSNDLVNGNADAILYKKMVQYTRQKAKANGNLVLLYTFMNLIALGMLFYVYKAT
jgi:hypothetical protein